MVSTLDTAAGSVESIARSFFIDDPETKWAVDTGFADVFAVIDSGLRFQLMRLEKGDTLFGLRSTEDEQARLLVCPGANSEILSQPVCRYSDRVAAERWMAQLASALELPKTAPESNWWTSLQSLHETASTALIARIARSEDASRHRLRAKAVSGSAAMRAAFADLAAPLSGSALTVSLEQTDPRRCLARAWAVISDALRIPFSPDQLSTLPVDDAIDSLAHAAGLRCRGIGLRGSWWKHDAGPLLAFRNNQPVALIPEGGSRYRLFDPSTGESACVDGSLAAQLNPSAYGFFRSLPRGPITLLRMLLFGLRECRTDLCKIAAMGLLNGALSLAVPIILAQMISFIIPAAEHGQVAILTALLAICSLCSALFSYASGVALQRVGGRAGIVIQNALWDRLLALPASFFSRFSAGDLSMRAESIDKVRNILTKPLIASALACPFCLAQVLLMFRYRPDMAGTALWLPALLIAISAVSSLRLARRYQAAVACQGILSGKVFQFLNGLAKLRVSGSESRAFASWARVFGKRRVESMRARNITAVLAGMQAAAPLLGWFLVALYGLGDGARESSQAGALLAFAALFQQVIGASVQLSSVIGGLAQVISVADRVHPILEASPELSTTRVAPGGLSGAIQIENLMFHYQPDRPLLRGVSFRVEPGEFVAFVGVSGCGKSTLLRLLLGFEQATGGNIYYDGKSIGILDLQALRRQMGVVLQNGRIFDGEIGHNIVGGTHMDLDSAWDAARMAGLEADIQAMPMKMHTYLGEGGAGLSGGQKQRLLIARALVNKPRIVLFDEATSALDNCTQAIVSASLDALKITRVVIAHRLSTIRNADRILVLHDGQITESGTYSQLIERRGQFYEMAKRQIAA